MTGAHRLAAARLLEWDAIECRYFDGTEVEARLWEIAENLHRADLTVQERADQTAEWVRLVEAPHIGEPLIRKDGKPLDSGISRAAEELPIPGDTKKAREHTVSRAIKVASIAPEAKAAAVDAGVTTQTALLKVAAEPTPQAQLAKVKELAETKAASKPKRGDGDGVAVVNSRDVAREFGKDHKHVLRDIKAIEIGPDLGTSWFRPAASTDSYGREQPSIDMTRDGFMLLVMGWTGERGDGDGVAVVNSRDVAREFGKRHDHVLRDLDALNGSPNLGTRSWFRETATEVTGGGGAVADVHQCSRFGYGGTIKSGFPPLIRALTIASVRQPRKPRGNHGTLHRRHLTEAQRTLIAARMANMPSHRPPQHKSANLPGYDNALIFPPNSQSAPQNAALMSPQDVRPAVTVPVAAAWRPRRPWERRQRHRVIRRA